MERPYITQHIHLDSIDSTQSYLKDNLEEGNLLVSAVEQTGGIGRQGNVWAHQKDSLAFSFTLGPNEIPTLTPLEVAVLITMFMEKYYFQKLKLKWPNDLLTEKGEKCGGILIQNIDGRLIVGVGINLTLGRPIGKRDCYPPGSIDLGAVPLKDLSASVYEYILNHRLKAQEVRALWTNRCIHLGKKVEIDKLSGLFEGIGNLGEALLKGEKRIKVFSGTLNPLT